MAVLGCESDWCLGFWFTPRPSTRTEDGFQYILSTKPIGYANSLNIFLQENNSGAALVVFLVDGQANVVINSGIPKVWSNDGSRFLCILQNRYSNFEIFLLEENASSVDPVRIPVNFFKSISVGDLPKDFYFGSSMSEPDILFLARPTPTNTTPIESIDYEPPDEFADTVIDPIEAPEAIEGDAQWVDIPESVEPATEAPVALPEPVADATTSPTIISVRTLYMDDRNRLRTRTDKTPRRASRHK